MIFDNISNALIYCSLGEKFKAAFGFLLRKDLGKLPEGKHQIIGDEVYADVQSYQTKPAEQGRWEAHKRYIDVHYILGGSEIVGFARTNNLKIQQEYSEQKDLMFLIGDGPAYGEASSATCGQFIKLSADDFVIFYPHEAHMPCLANGEPSRVRKVVLKILA